MGAQTQEAKAFNREGRKVLREGRRENLKPQRTRRTSAEFAENKAVNRKVRNKILSLRTLRYLCGFCG
jgi:hypothetical protein